MMQDNATAGLAPASAEALFPFCQRLRTGRPTKTSNIGRSRNSVISASGLAAVLSSFHVLGFRHLHLLCGRSAVWEGTSLHLSPPRDALPCGTRERGRKFDIVTAVWRVLDRLTKELCPGSRWKGWYATGYVEDGTFCHASNSRPPRRIPSFIDRQSATSQTL